jgi:hypothetical protein
VFSTVRRVLRLRRPVVVGAFALAWAAGCGSSDPSSTSPGEPLAYSSSAIQGGTTDTTHNFAVGIVVHQSQSMVAFCSGVLLAPNLVATARHCVSQLSNAQIDCATSMFMATLPASYVHVTPSPVMTTASSVYYNVSNVIVPTGAGMSGVCGNDIALLILSNSIQMSEYVTPAINPPMTDHIAYSTAVTAIGYGVNTPADTMGTSAGTRRIKENIRLVCIPNDKTFVDCYSFQNARQFIDPKEFEGGDGTCEGDSGSGAFDQGNFASGKWVAFGVLSRGGGTPEGGVCLGSVYTRFDSWSQLIIDAAAQASTLGGYSPPSWTGLPALPVDAGGSSSGSSSPEASTSAPSPSPDGGRPGACLPSGLSCSDDSQCCSASCIAYGSAPYSCSCDSINPCGAGYLCQRGVCVTAPPDAGTVGVTVRAGGCAVSSPGSTTPLPWRASAVVAVAALALARRRRGCRNLDSHSDSGRLPDPS